MYVIENSSADPLEKTWEFKGELEEPSNNWAIDGTPLEYNGQLYFIWWGKTNNAPTQILYITKMTNPYTLKGSRIAISTPVYDWEKHGNPINEGPEILKNKDGDVFLICSGSNFATDDYCLGLLSLKKNGDPLNPSDWTKKVSLFLAEMMQPVLMHRGITDFLSRGTVLRTGLFIMLVHSPIRDLPITVTRAFNSLHGIRMGYLILGHP